MLAKLRCLVKLALIDPQLMLLVWRLKRTKKTYLGCPQLLSLAEGFLRVKARQPAPLQIAEFGVGRGGSAMLLAWLIGRHGGTLTLYDLFGQIPAPTAVDGERAQQRYDIIVNQERETYYGNIPNLKKLILAELSTVCAPEQIITIEGRYEETLDQYTDKNTFSLVHVDCDWYESYKAVLMYLQDNIRPGAIIQLDDYSNWIGSQKATTESSWLSPYQSWLVDGTLVIDTANTKTS